MTAFSQPPASADFFALASRLALLSEPACQELAREAATSGAAPARLALERGLLTAVQIDILDTLSQSDSAIPGYKILDVLGHGGMGVVYRALQKNLDRVVALKTVLVGQMTQSGMLARFEQEALAVAQMRHPNIVMAYDFGRNQGRLYLAMELIEGEELGDLIARRGRLDERTAWGLARQAAAGLSHAARSGVVHRDVKPANLLLVAPPEGFVLPDGLPMVKITDFGLALLTGDQEVDERLTVAGSTLGTPRYMAPEQFQGSDVDLRADIYALGATVYHMLAGSAPFPEKHLAQVLARKLNGRAAPLASVATGVSTATQELVDAMMHPDRAFRVSTYEELFARMDRLLQDNLPQNVTARRKNTVVPNAGGSTDATVVLPAQSTVVAPVAGLRRPNRAIAVTTAAILLIALGWVWWIWPPLPGQPAAMTMLAPTDRGEFLYDGETLRGWNPLDGQWTQAKDAEGARVLSGKGLVRRTLPQRKEYANYRLSLAVCLNQASAVELHFGLAALPGEDLPRYALRIARQGVDIGRKLGDRSELQRIGTRRPFPADEADAPGYHELRAERHETQWLVFFDGQMLERVPVQPSGEASEFRLLTEGGPAWIESVQMTELARPRSVSRE